MKKFSVYLYALGFLFGLVGTASAILFADIKPLIVPHTGGPLAGLIYSTDYPNIHDIPGDFGSPLEVVNSAALPISGYSINGNDEIAEVESTAMVLLNEDGSRINRWWPSWEAQSYSAIISRDDDNLEFASSISSLKHTYTNIAYFESATMLLFGFFLIGLARLGRKRLSKKTIGSERFSQAHGW